MAKKIMIQGTMSNSGKSFLAAALCRIFRQDGYRVAPFKSQNMALNSYITKDGLEIGRAQAMQAEAAGIEPTVDMNPILLKPTSQMGSQVIVGGEVAGNWKAMDYYRRKQEFIPMIRAAFARLEENYDIIVLEGAGSPAEINLREHDIVNMGMAELADAPVLLVGDIDRGGVFASLYGTVALLEPEERARIRGLVINKFRGDKKILEPGLRMIEEKLHIPVVGVIPMEQIDIDDEDSLSERLTRTGKMPGAGEQELDVAVIRLPHISNFTDFNVLERRQGVCLRYVERTELLGRPDLVILPGTKNTLADLRWLRQSGLEPAILRLSQEQQIPVIGICGGYQMLGTWLRDPDGVEGTAGGSMRGMGLLAAETVFAGQKTRTQMTGTLYPESRMFAGNSSKQLRGYEIHMGITRPLPPESEPNAYAARPGSAAEMPEEARQATKRGNPEPQTAKEQAGMMHPAVLLADGRMDGMERADGLVFGSYLHGLFDNEWLTDALLCRLAAQKGIKLTQQEESIESYKERQYDKLAALVRGSLDMEQIYVFMESGSGSR